MEMDKIMQLAIKMNASDIHIVVGRPPCLRVHGMVLPLDNMYPPLGSKDAEALMKSITPDYHRQKIEEVGGVDFGLSYEKDTRFRVSAFKQRGNYSVVLRQIPKRILNFDQIGLPPQITDVLKKPRGLVLVVGPTGSGKSTTLATCVDYINQTRNAHILTIEDPIEYYHDHKKSIVNQREVGVDVSSFSEALKKGLRQDPDVILVGEMRDLETMEAAISAAETGHLVLATLHTTGAARTVDRIIDSFPGGQQQQIRTQLASSIESIVSQLLLPKTDGSGRVAVIEFMKATHSIRNLIRENKTYQIVSDIQTGSKLGMKTFDTRLVELYFDGTISLDDAIASAYDPKWFSDQVTRLKSK